MQIKHSKNRKSKKRSKKINVNDGSMLNKLKNKYIIYTKKGCSFCSDAKLLLSSRGLKFISKDYHELDDNAKSKVMNKIKLYNNGKEYNSFPKIFRNNDFIGGFDKLSDLLN